MTTQLVTKFKTNSFAPRPDTASEEEKMPCPDRSLCISSFDLVRLGFGGESLNEFRRAPGPAHGEGCYNAWCLLFPQHPTVQIPHLALKTQSSTSSELEMCEKTKAAVPVLGSFPLYSTHPKPPKETRQSAAGWSHAACTHLRSDI